MYWVFVDGGRASQGWYQFLVISYTLLHQTARWIVYPKNQMFHIQKAWPYLPEEPLEKSTLPCTHCHSAGQARPLTLCGSLFSVNSVCTSGGA